MGNGDGPVMVLAMAADASAQRLMETDGIELRGAARIVTFAAGLCNVVEASHTAAEYERIRGNHGQPLDVRQLDFSVYNGSGKWLDHLIARYGIESRWPDCTNWSEPSGTYSDLVHWTSTSDFIQETGRNVVAPGATLTETKFIIVFHEDPPLQFSNWSVDFTFGESTGVTETTGDAARTASVPGSPPAADRPAEAPAPTESGHPSRIGAGQTGAGQPEGAACLMEVANQPQCYVWNPNPQTDDTVTWTGECAGAWTQVTGTLTWVWNNAQNTAEETGRLQDGQRNGQWVLRFADGIVAEGPFVDGEKNGQWVLRFPSGNVAEVPYVEGQRHGTWVVRHGDGHVLERQRVVNGVRQN